MSKHLEDRHSTRVRRAGEKFDYKLPHDYTRQSVAQDYPGMDNPTEQGAEKLVKERFLNWRKQFQEARKQNVTEPPAVKNNQRPGT